MEGQKAEVAVYEKPQGGASAGASWVSDGGHGPSPWFLFTTPQSEKDDGDDPGMVVALRIDPLNKLPAEVVMSMPVPKPFERYRLVNPLPRAGGGGPHYLVIKNQSKPRSAIHIVDPFSSSSWISLSTLPGGDRPAAWSILKVVTRNHSIDPGTPVVAIAQPYRCLVWTKVGESPYCWRTLSGHFSFHFECWFSDVIWSASDNLFWATLTSDNKMISFDFSCGSGSGKIVDVQEVSVDLEPGFDDLVEVKGWRFHTHSLFVDAPSGLFMVRWERLTKPRKKQKTKQRKLLHVYKLLVNGDHEKKWKRVSSLDNYSFFLGSNNSMALSPADFPGLRTNCIYLPFNGRYPAYDYMEPFGLQDFDPEDLKDLQVNWIHDLEKGSWERCKGAEAWVVPFNRCPLPVAWVMPHTDTVPYI